MRLRQFLIGLAVLAVPLGIVIILLVRWLLEFEAFGLGLGEFACLATVAIVGGVVLLFLSNLKNKTLQNIGKFGLVSYLLGGAFTVMTYGTFKFLRNHMGLDLWLVFPIAFFMVVASVIAKKMGMELFWDTMKSGPGKAIILMVGVFCSVNLISILQYGEIEGVVDSQDNVQVQRCPGRLTLTAQGKKVRRGAHLIDRHLKGCRRHAVRQKELLSYDEDRDAKLVDQMVAEHQGTLQRIEEAADWGPWMQIFWDALIGTEASAPEEDRFLPAGNQTGGVIELPPAPPSGGTSGSSAPGSPAVTPPPAPAPGSAPAGTVAPETPPSNPSPETPTPVLSTANSMGKLKKLPMHNGTPRRVLWPLAILAGCGALGSVAGSRVRFDGGARHGHGGHGDAPPPPVIAPANPQSLWDLGGAIGVVVGLVLVFCLGLRQNSEAGGLFVGQFEGVELVPTTGREVTLGVVDPNDELYIIMCGDPDHMDRVVQIQYSFSGGAAPQAVYMSGRLARLNGSGEAAPPVRKLDPPGRVAPRPVLRMKLLSEQSGHLFVGTARQLAAAGTDQCRELYGARADVFPGNFLRRKLGFAEIPTFRPRHPATLAAP